MSEQQTETDPAGAEPVRLAQGSNERAVPVRFEIASLRRGAIVVFAVVLGAIMLGIDRLLSRRTD